MLHIERRLFAPETTPSAGNHGSGKQPRPAVLASRSPGEERKAPIESCGGTLEYHKDPSGPAESDGAKRRRTHRQGNRWCHGQGTRFEDRVKDGSFLESRMTGTLACISAGWELGFGI